MIIKEFGPPSVFHKADVPKPQVKPGHLLIHVKATSVNPIDTKIRSGAVAAIAPEFPAVLHGDVAGVVVEVGANVHHFKAGDEVYACAGGVKGTGGALAEYMLADADTVAKKPKKLSFAQAAALPLVTITAWTALFLRANLKSKQTLLVHGGVGGVGHIGVQLGKSVGASVSATVSSEEDFAIVRRLGADHPINYREEQVADYVKRITHGKGFEVIFDPVGGKNLENSFQAAALDGVIATTAARTTLDITPMHQKALSLHAVFMLLPLIFHYNRKHQGEILEKAAHLVDEGKLMPLIDPQTFTIPDVAKAHEYLESGKAKGKVVLTW
jgi:NADPH:quinone reductase